MSADAPLGTFEEQVLLGVARAGDDAFGMNVRRIIEHATGRDVAIGAVYATLDRLEAKQLVRSFRTTRDGRSRRMFRVTREGVGALHDSRAMRERLWQGVRFDGLPDES